MRKTGMAIALLESKSWYVLAPVNAQGICIFMSSLVSKNFCYILAVTMKSILGVNCN
jgi:citrate lyase gamma subunit